MSTREIIREKKRIVIKIGSSTLTHMATGNLNLIKMEAFIRQLCDLRNQGKDIVVVSSGAIAVGRKAVHLEKKEETLAKKQACAAIGQARLMMAYQKIFGEYNQITAQVLMTKNTVMDPLNRRNAHNTFTELLKMGVIPIVNENDTVATYEIEFGDNDTLSAIVASLIEGDLLILLSDIDGLYTDDPRENDKAEFIHKVEKLDERFFQMGKETTGSAVGTGGMWAKLHAAQIATKAGADMIIANGEDMHIIHKIMEGEAVGTWFLQDKDHDFYLPDYIQAVYED